MNLVKTRKDSSVLILQYSGPKLVEETSDSGHHKDGYDIDEWFTYVSV